MTTNILHVSPSGSWSDRSDNIEKRKYGIVFGKLYSALRKLQRYSIHGTQFLSKPLRRFLTSVEEVPCTFNAVKVNKKVDVQHGHVLESFVQPLILNVKSCRILKDGDEYFLRVEYRDGTHREIKGLQTDAYIIKYKAHPNNVVALHSLKRNDNVNDKEKTISFQVKGDTYFVKNEKPFDADTIFSVKDSVNHSNVCYLNKPIYDLQSGECPYDVPFMPNTHTAVSIVNLLQKGFIFDVKLVNGSMSTVVCVNGMHRTATAACTPPTTLVLKKLPKINLPMNTDILQPRMVEINRDDVDDSDTYLDDENCIHCKLVSQFRGPYIRNFSSDQYRQASRKCDTSTWKKRLHRRQRYVEHSREPPERQFTIENLGDVSPQILFSQLTRIDLRSEKKQGVVHLEFDSSKNVFAPKSDTVERFPYYVSISRMCGTDSVREYYCNLKLHEEPSVCAYVRGHDSPYVLSAIRLKDTWDVDRNFQSSPPPKCTKRVMDGGPSSGTGTTQDDNEAMAYGLRHEQDALLTLQQYLDTHAHNKYVIVSNKHLSFELNNTKTTPDGFVYEKESGTFIAVVEAKSHMSGFVMTTPRQKAVDQLRMHMDSTGLRRGFLVSWAIKHSMIYEYEYADIVHQQLVRSVVHKSAPESTPLHDSIVKKKVHARISKSTVDMICDDKVHTMRNIPCVPTYSLVDRYGTSRGIQKVDSCADDTCEVHFYNGTRAQNTPAEVFTSPILCIRFQVSFVASPETYDVISCNPDSNNLFVNSHFLFRPKGGQTWKYCDALTDIDSRDFRIEHKSQPYAHKVGHSYRAECDESDGQLKVTTVHSNYAPTTWLRITKNGTCSGVFAQDSKQSIQRHLSCLRTVQRLYELANPNAWMNWWTGLMVLIALDPDLRKGTIIVIDPDISCAECERSAVAAAVMMAEMCADAAHLEATTAPSTNSFGTVWTRVEPSMLFVEEADAQNPTFHSETLSKELQFKKRFTVRELKEMDIDVSSSRNMVIESNHKCYCPRYDAEEAPFALRSRVLQDIARHNTGDLSGPSTIELSNVPSHDRPLIPGMRVFVNGANTYMLVDKDAVSSTDYRFMRQIFNGCRLPHFESHRLQKTLMAETRHVRAESKF